jgi:diaminopimelate decarboxylase
VDPVRPRSTEPRRWDIVGPVCESGDFLALDRALALHEDDLLAIRSTGAYAMTMSSNYNARPRACELIVDSESVHVARRRERINELFATESRLP